MRHVYARLATTDIDVFLVARGPISRHRRVVIHGGADGVLRRVPAYIRVDTRTDEDSVVCNVQLALALESAWIPQSFSLRTVAICSEICERWKL